MLSLPIAAVLFTVALGAPAMSAAKPPPKVSAAVDPSCGSASVAATWTPVSGQQYVDVSVSDNQTGTVVDAFVAGVSPSDDSYVQTLSGLFSPLASGKHAFKVTVTVLDSALNPLVSGKDNANAPCVLGSVLPT
jgi:hypothetical protein